MSPAKLTTRKIGDADVTAKWDTADICLDSKDLIGNWSASFGRAAYVHEAIEKSFKRLGADSIDLDYLHRHSSRCPPSSSPRAHPYLLDVLHLNLHVRSARPKPTIIVVQAIHDTSTLWHDEHEVTTDDWKRTLAVSSGLCRIAVADTKDNQDEDEGDEGDENDEGKDDQGDEDNPEESAEDNPAEDADDEENESAEVRRSPPTCERVYSIARRSEGAAFLSRLVARVSRGSFALRTSRGHPLKNLTIWVKSSRKDLKANPELAMKRREPFIAALPSLVQELRFEDLSH
ncbi:hypothetical protein C8Q76DRAFT_801564 [Earliella scabrosa]|nr:hypothetical protein C8Q76DRAFT_801564 [Earliella scabrosa]